MILEAMGSEIRAYFGLVGVSPIALTENLLSGIEDA